MVLSDLLQDFLTSLIQSWYNKNVTGLMTQVVTILLYHDYIGLVGTTLQQVWQYQGCYKLLPACSKLVDNLGQAVRTQLVDGLLADLLQGVKFCGLPSYLPTYIPTDLCFKLRPAHLAWFSWSYIPICVTFSIDHTETGLDLTSITITSFTWSTRERGSCACAVHASIIPRT
jgi:hypothetical protein